MLEKSRVVLADNLSFLAELPSRSVSLIYIDPPFGQGHTQRRERVRVKADPDGDRVGFGDRRYAVEERVASPSYSDSFADYEAFLMRRIGEAVPALTPDGSLFVHLNAANVHYIKVALDRLLGRHRFINEIVWAYDYGGRPRDRWPAKHDTILWYVMDPENYVFNYEEIDRIPYMAPSLVGAEKAERGKTPTDVWWNTIVPTNGKEKTGYPTQKPLGIMNRLVRVHSRPGDTVLDFFAGSGSTGEAALLNGRKFILVDNNVEAFDVMRRRFADRQDVVFEGHSSADISPSAG